MTMYRPGTSQCLSAGRHTLEVEGTGPLVRDARGALRRREACFINAEKSILPMSAPTGA